MEESKGMLINLLNLLDCRKSIYIFNENEELLYNGDVMTLLVENPKYIYFSDVVDFRLYSSSINVKIKISKLINYL